MQLLASEASNPFSNAQRSKQPVRKITPNHLAASEDSFSKQPHFGKSSFKDNVGAARDGANLLRQTTRIGSRNTFAILGGLGGLVRDGNFMSGARQGARIADRNFESSQRRWNEAGGTSTHRYTAPPREKVRVYVNNRYSHTEYR